MFRGGAREVDDVGEIVGVWIIHGALRLGDGAGVGWHPLRS